MQIVRACYRCRGECCLRSLILFQKSVMEHHCTTSPRPFSVFQSSPMSTWHCNPMPRRSWWQYVHSKGSYPVPNNSQRLFTRKLQPFCAPRSVAKACSHPLNAGESTPKDLSMDISSIMREAYPANSARAASSTVHQPGRLQ